jgi:hypothetical protein
MHEGRGRALCAGLHEALPRVALRQRGLVRHARHGRLASLCHPENGIGYGYVTSQVGTSLTGDPWELALRQAVYESLGGVTGKTEDLIP